MMADKKTRKVTQMGNSLGIGLPKDIVAALNIKRGDEIEFEVQDNRMMLSKKTSLEDQVDVEMMKMLSETFKEHHRVFERLKDR
ncbi:AbrB/MazE/SpoVT family DNA-binding domain-containing protein [Virgibacillus sp. FSP13]